MTDIEILQRKIDDVTAILVEPTIKKPQDRINHALAILSIEPPRRKETKLTLCHIGILKEIGAGTITLTPESSPWLCDRVIELGLFEPPLIDVKDGAVLLTQAGRAIFAPVVPRS